MSRRVFRGIGVSKGVGTGRCFLAGREKAVEKEARKGDMPRKVISPEKEIELLESAVMQVEQDLQRIIVGMESEARKDAANVLEAQLLLLRDPLFIDEVKKSIRTQVVSAENAVSQVAISLKRKFSSLSTERMRERGEDVIEIASRIVGALTGRLEDLEPSTELLAKEKRVVLVSRKLAVATVAKFGRKLLAGIVAETGSKTSHLAIVARSLKIPAVLGATNITKELNEGELVIVDGDKGEVTVNPPEPEANRVKAEMLVPPKEVGSVWNSTNTIDGHRVRVFANVTDLDGVREASMSGAEGIGLFRTEFLYLDRSVPPTEDELYEVMRQSVLMMQGRSIVVRTLDIGGDKVPSYLELQAERNPALGLRGIRFSLNNTSLLETQLAAILRASALGSVMVMFPMVSTLRELREAKRITEEVKQKLRRRDAHFNPNIKIGIMVETPSAALMADVLAPEVNFFSIGTNDLVQYTLAADRESASTAAVADPLEPSVLRLISQTINIAHKKKIKVGVCGEMAADLDSVPILLGLGLDDFSVDSSNVQAVRKTIQSLMFSKAKKAALESLSLESASEAREFSRRRFPRERH